MPQYKIEGHYINFNETEIKVTLLLSARAVFGLLDK